MRKKNKKQVRVRIGLTSPDFRCTQIKQRLFTESWQLSNTLEHCLCLHFTCHQDVLSTNPPQLHHLYKNIELTGGYQKSGNCRFLYYGIAE